MNPVRDENGYGFSANGARSLQNNFLLDGIDNNSNLPDLLNEANYVVMPSVDALQEFRVETNSYAAEFGRATGAVVNATIKSGTNGFHGVVYEFVRNQMFDARNFYDSTLPPPSEPVRSNAGRSYPQQALLFCRLRRPAGEPGSNVHFAGSNSHSERR